MAKVLDGREVAAPQELFLQGPKEAFNAAVAFGLAHEGGRGRDAEEGDLGLEVRTEIHAAVIVPQRQARRDGRRERPEVVADALAQGLERFEAIAVLGGMNPDALGGAMVDRREDVLSTIRRSSGIDPIAWTV